MRIIGALVIASAIPILLLGAFGLISTTAAVVISITAMVIGIVIVGLDSI